jgi:hypothetical protein
MAFDDYKDNFTKFPYKLPIYYPLFYSQSFQAIAVTIDSANASHPVLIFLVGVNSLRAT